ncbi:MAG TPA: hypothetical protein VHQ01_07630 [Pyrinomonadaceae bacterium]|jgi:hypothetical protein|nr:hypothetical protein [Pyrinomonadaceae bacterium]
MYILRLGLACVLLASIGPVFIAAQASGSLDVQGKALKIDGKSGAVSRKRFYLFKGGLKDNQDLIARLRTAEIKSRDCFYTQMKASPQYICWLQAENCESPFCRTVATADIPKVPEFQAAYNAGLTKFRGLKTVADDWILTNMPAPLVSGFFDDRRALTTSLLGGLKPVQSTMTDSVTIKAIFIDLAIAPPTGKKTDTFLLSNIQPLEFGTKSYVWACEVEVGTEKKAVFNLPDPTKPPKTCEVVIRDLPVCKTESCKAT